MTNDYFRVKITGGPMGYQVSIVDETTGKPLYIVERADIEISPTGPIKAKFIVLPKELDLKIDREHIRIVCEECEANRAPPSGGQVSDSESFGVAIDTK